MTRTEHELRKAEASFARLTPLTRSAGWAAIERRLRVLQNLNRLRERAAAERAAGKTP